MADDQTPNSDLIEDALRQAERQLEQRLEALRMSALGETTSDESSTIDPDVAVLRPTGGRSAESVFGDKEREDAPDAPLDQVWSEASDSDDLMFQPSGASPFDAQHVAGDAPLTLDDEPADVVDTVKGGDEPAMATHVPNLDDEEFVTPAALEPETRASELVNEMASTWTDLDAPGMAFHELDDEPSGDERDAHVTLDSSTTGGVTPVGPIKSVSMRPSGDSWADNRNVSVVSAGSPVAPMPSEEQMQFWAQTRTALRALQQAADGIPSTVQQHVKEDVERIVHDEVSTAAASIRLLQQQVQQGLPKIVDRVEASIEQGVAGPSSALRQLRDELPQQVDRGGRELRTALREDLDASAASTQSALQRDVSQLEQSIAANVTRLAQTLGDDVSGVERDVEQLGETILRFERGMRTEFERVETQLHETIAQVETTLRDELVEPTETVRKLDEELPSRFGRIERAVTELVQSSQRDITGMLSTLVDVNRATLERLGDIAQAHEQERARRSEDTELVVDTVTTGWEAIAGAVKTLYTQNEQLDRRMKAMEERVAHLRDVEEAVNGTLRRFDQHIAELSPAPVVVTVSHPEASVENTSKGGWTKQS